MKKPNLLTDAQIAALELNSEEKEIIRISQDLGGKDFFSTQNDIITNKTIPGAPSIHTTNKIIQQPLWEFTPNWRTPFKTIAYGCAGQPDYSRIEGFMGIPIRQGSDSIHETPDWTYVSKYNVHLWNYYKAYHVKFRILRRNCPTNWQQDTFALRMINKHAFHLTCASSIYDVSMGLLIYKDDWQNHF